MKLKDSAADYQGMIDKNDKKIQNVKTYLEDNSNISEENKLRFNFYIHCLEKCNQEFRHLLSYCLYLLSD